MPPLLEELLDGLENPPERELDDCRLGLNVWLEGCGLDDLTPEFALPKPLLLGCMRPTVVRVELS